MFFNRKQKHLVRLLLIIRSSEAEHETNPNGVRDFDPKYFRQMYVRYLKIPYPPFLGMQFVEYGTWEKSKVIKIKYDEDADLSICTLEDVVYDHDYLMDHMAQIKYSLISRKWDSTQHAYPDPILDSDVEPKRPNVEF